MPSQWQANCQFNPMKPMSSRPHRDDSADLNCYIHDGAAQLRFEIEGSLSGQAAMRLEQSWLTASSVIGGRSLVISLGNITNIDPFGRALLLKWHENGAQFVPRSHLAATVVSSIIGRQVICASADRGREKWARYRLHLFPLVLLLVLLFPSVVKAASLDPVTSRSWQEMLSP